MNRLRPTTAPKQIRRCNICGKIGECYPNRAQCCKCFGRQQKQYRVEFGNAAAAAWQRQHAEYRQRYNAEYYAAHRERIQAQRKAVRCGR